MSDQTKKYNKDSPLRSALKGFTWRITATLTTILIAYFTTGNVDVALQIGGIEFFVKFVIYYGHERAWALVPHGTFRRLWNNFMGRKDDVPL